MNAASTCTCDPTRVSAVHETGQPVNRLHFRSTPETMQLRIAYDQGVSTPCLPSQPVGFFRATPQDPTGFLLAQVAAQAQTIAALEARIAALEARP